MLRFDPETGLTAPTTAEIRAQIQADWQAAFSGGGSPTLSVAPETPAGQLIDSEAAIVADKNAEILYLANMFNPRTASGVWQAALGQIYFLTPKMAQSSVAICTCSGLSGTVIPAGSMIRSTYDNTDWLSVSDATIPYSGSVSVQFLCTTTGAISAGAGTLTQIVTVTPGWDSVTNPAAATIGYDAETQQAFEARRYNSVAANAHGSVAALYGALYQLDGVIDLAVFDNTQSTEQVIYGATVPPHSVWITVVGGADTDIARVIYQKKDAGCGTGGNTQVSYTDTTLPSTPTYTYNICRPQSVTLYVQIVIASTANTPADIENLIKNAVLDECSGMGSNLRIGTAQTIYASRFVCPSISAGADGFISAQVSITGSTGPWTSSVDITALQTPVITADNITVTIQD